MIRVDSSFYESGCTMEGKGNRIFLKGKDGKGNMEMTFFGDEVKVTAARGLLNVIIPFKDIEEILVIKNKITGESVPAIALFHSEAN